jgi:FkbM family methyltransferase
MGSLSPVSPWSRIRTVRGPGLWSYFGETHGSRAVTTAKVLCNKASYVVMRAVQRRNPPGSGWHTSPRHWYRFPFSLRGEVLWSPQLAAWFCPANEASIELMLHEADYEPVEWVDLSEGDVFLDVGAFVGWHSIRAARIVGPSARVISLEPDVSNRTQLEANLALNHVTNCAVVPLGAWSKTGEELGWYTEKSPDCCRIEVDQSSRAIRTTTIDDLILEMSLTRLDWIKMDIEGAEVEALKGAENTLRRFRPHLFVEIHNTVEPVKELLARFGYAIEREAYDGSPEPHGWFQARAT